MHASLRCIVARRLVERQEAKKRSSSNGQPKYTCLVSAFHRPATTPGRNHTFSKRDGYIRHLKGVHFDGKSPPAFVLRRLRIEHGGELRDGVRSELWIG